MSSYDKGWVRVVVRRIMKVVTTECWRVRSSSVNENKSQQLPKVYVVNKQLGECFWNSFFFIAQKSSGLDFIK